MRQLGIGSQGGAEALAIDEWVAGSTACQNQGCEKIVLEWSNGRQCARRRRGFSPNTRQQRHGNIETCLMLNTKRFLQCPKIEMQSKEM